MCIGSPTLWVRLFWEIGVALIPNGQNVFVVDIEYVVALKLVEPLIEKHMDFLDRNYAAGYFLVSGAKVPRTGGVILATAASVEQLHELIAQDPFHIQQIAKYTITEFRAGRAADGLR